MSNLTKQQFEELYAKHADKIGGSPYTVNLGQTELSNFTFSKEKDGDNYKFTVVINGNNVISWSRVAKPTIIALKECPKETSWTNKKTGESGTIAAGTIKVVLT